MSQRTPTDVETDAYAQNFILHGDQVRAWRVAFPDSKAKAKTQHELASKLHKRPKVRSRIAELQSINNESSEKKFGTTVDDIKQKLMFAIKRGLDDKYDQQGNKIPISIPGAVSAMAELNKMDGNHHQYEVKPIEVAPITIKVVRACRK